jgi:hypothetical protein
LSASGKRTGRSSRRAPRDETLELRRPTECRVDRSGSQKDAA